MTTAPCRLCGRLWCKNKRHRRAGYLVHDTMRRNLIALVLLGGVHVHCFGVSLLFPRKCRSSARHPSSLQLASVPENAETSLAETMLPPDEVLDIGPSRFERNQKWLEEATAEMLDLKTFPIGTLTADDVDSITGLMAAWVRRRSMDAALMVEELLKRVVDDLRAGNQSIQVTTRMYTIVSK